MSAVHTQTWKFEPLDPEIDRTEIDPGSLALSRDDLLKTLDTYEANGWLKAAIRDNNPGGHLLRGTLDVPIPFNPPLEHAVLPNTGRIEAEARKLLEY